MIEIFVLVLFFLIFYFAFIHPIQNSEQNKDQKTFKKSAIFKTSGSATEDKNMMFTKTDGNIDTISLGKILPRRTIVAWYPESSDESPPEGWFICNGQNGTPDLRGRFVLGWNPKDQKGVVPNTLDRTLQNNLGDKGGEREHKLTIEEMPKHSHNIYGTGNQNSDHHEDPRFWAGGGGTKSKTEEGGDKPHNIIPPYFVLIYIMKK